MSAQIPTLTRAQALGLRQMSSFVGMTPSAEILAAIQAQHLGGITLFRPLNIDNPAQVRELTTALQRAAATAGQPPLLIGVDQEGGTLMALAETTQFPGNLALGAARSPELARRTGYALGLELAAMGLNVNYAPVCDLNVNLANPVVGTRSFGSDPARVAELGAALVTGLQAAGVAATAKHFPGHGDTPIDSHHGTPVVPHDADHLRRVELRPFAAAIAAGVKLVMTGHVALPAITGRADLPATLSPEILGGLLRGELGFDGVIISDALDMKAFAQGEAFVGAVGLAAAAGVDLLTLNAELAEHRTVLHALELAADRGLLTPAAIQASAARVLALKAWCAQVAAPSLEVVGCAEHQALALEIAAKSVTLVRDTAGRLPLDPARPPRLAVVVPQPRDLTPADTSSYVKPELAAALRAYSPQVDEFSVPLDPSAAEVSSLSDTLRAGGYEQVVIGTINANDHTGQAALVNALLAHGLPVIAVALRMPHDLLAYPSAPTYVCTYSILPPAMQAAAQALFGQIPFVGQLPVTLPAH